MRGTFECIGGLLTEESADGHVITYMRISYEGEGPFHESTRPIALGMDDGTPQPPGPSHEQVAERLVRQANYGLYLLTEDDVPKRAREFFFAAINRPLIPREFAVPHEGAGHARGAAGAGRDYVGRLIAVAPAGRAVGKRPTALAPGLFLHRCDSTGDLRVPREDSGARFVGHRNSRPGHASECPPAHPSGRAQQWP